MTISESKQRVVFTLEKAILTELKQLADKDRRTVSAYLAILVEDHIERMKKG